jgi:hypothetical protein
VQELEEFEEKAQDQAYQTALVSLLPSNMQLKRLSAILF